MSGITIALAIPSAADWMPDRAASLVRLHEGLGIVGFRKDGSPATRDPWPVTHYREFRDREPNGEWSRKLWTWGLETGADFLLQIQDDVIVTPRFWDHLSAMLAAVPRQIIGLETVHDRSKQLHASGVRWCTTADGLVGVAYVLPRQVLDTFLRWSASGLVEGWQADEDMLIDCFALATGQRIWHPLPTIIDHDVSLVSNYGHENHTHRRPPVTLVGHPDGWQPHDWTPNGTPHLGLFYEHTPALCRRIVKGFGEAEYWRAKTDVWRGFVA